MLTGPLALADAEVLNRQSVRAFLERSDDLRFFLHEDAEMTLVLSGDETVRGREALLSVLLGRDPRFEGDRCPCRAARGRRGSRRGVGPDAPARRHHPRTAGSLAARAP